MAHAYVPGSFEWTSFFQTRRGGRHIAWGLCHSWGNAVLLRGAIAGIFGFR
jgi:hypothetical protein